MADPQFGMYRAGKDFKHERENLSRAVEAINRLHPDFVVICGDLVNKAGDSHQISAFKQTMAAMDTTIPLYYVPGNHDVENRPTPASMRMYRENFGPDYYSFERHGVTFIVLNSSLMKDPSKARVEASVQKRWLTDVLTGKDSSTQNLQLRTPNSHPDIPNSDLPTRNSKPAFLNSDSLTQNSQLRTQNYPLTIVFQHHPWFLKKPGELSLYYNMPSKMRKEYLDLFIKHGVTNVFAGHLHANAGGRYKSLEMVTTGPVGLPLGIDPSGIRIVIVRPKGIEHKYYGLGKIPEKIELDGDK